MNYSLEGHTFCPLFGNFPSNDERNTYIYSDGSFSLSGKADQYFQGSYTIGIDIDETCYSTPEAFVDTLSIKPTFWYTSFSNMQIDKESGESKGARFRLIYVFDEKIQDKYFFRYCSYTLHQLVETDSGELIKDKCGLLCSQYFNGTNWNDKTLLVDYGLTNNIYSKSDFNIDITGYIYFLESNCMYKNVDSEKEKDIQERIRLLLPQVDIINIPPTQLISTCGKSKRPSQEQNCVTDYVMLNDSERLPWEEFYSIYKHRYQYVYRVEKDNWETIGEIQYQLCDENYLELRWIPDEMKITDGHHRRSTLFHRAWLRRLIKSDISPNELLYNIIIDRHRFFDNSDGCLSNRTIVQKVNDCYRYEVEQLKEMYPDVYRDIQERSRKKKVILHWSCKKKINANKLVTQLRWKLFDVIYDKNLTTAENKQSFNDIGILISDDTINRYLKARGITTTTKKMQTYNKFKELHKSGMTLREEQLYLEQRGLHISSIKTLSIYKKKYSEENTGKDE